ncbi:MAG: nucleotidyltransferase domain-containing protein [Deltaproteobacteria bacterium]|nr:nucleotidyltransferase domain-containing protein [Deltaproteobacteria bacterium]
MSRRKLPLAVDSALDELRKYLIELYGEKLEGIYLYGSYARGDYRADSDVDVLIKGITSMAEGSL